MKNPLNGIIKALQQITALFAREIAQNYADLRGQHGSHNEKKNKKASYINGLQVYEGI